MKPIADDLSLAIEYIEQSSAVSDYDKIALACQLLRRYKKSNEGLFGFDEWWQKRGYSNDRPSDRYFAEDAWKAARGEQYYPCDRCGTWRTEAEGGTTFNVCDDCLNKKS